jgi:hypothetical protein
MKFSSGCVRGKKGEQKSRLFEFWGRELRRGGNCFTSTGSKSAVLENAVFDIYFF